MYKVMIITLSDRAAQGIYEDKSGRYLCEYMIKNDFKLHNYQVIPDVKQKLNDLILQNYQACDLIITTGGTGLTSSDITVDVIEELMDYEIRGMSTAMHNLNLSKSAGAMFSRGLCAVKDKCLIMSFPGSLKAVSELSEYFVPHLKHGLDHLNDVSVH